jgi:hypothetical protein
MASQGRRRRRTRPTSWPVRSTAAGGRPGIEVELAMRSGVGVGGRVNEAALDLDWGRGGR